MELRRKRNLAAYEAWMARKREARPRQFWVEKGPGPEGVRVAHWAKATHDPARDLLTEIFGGAA